MSEGPKQFLQQHVPPKKVSIICPIQGREDVFRDEDGTYIHFSSAEIDPKDAGKIPPYFEAVEVSTERIIYDASDLYILELLNLLDDLGVNVLEAFRVWPTETMINPFDIEEAEDPKSFLRRASSNKIWPSENYYLNIWKPTERWQDGEFCPGQVNENNEFIAFDGMYGLVDAVYQAIGIGDREPNAAEEERFEQEMDKYDNAMYGGIKRGETSGSMDGIAGPYHWQLVYDPSRDKDERGLEQPPFNDWASQLQIVRPGQQYGTRITPKTDRSQWIAFGGNVDPNAVESQANQAVAFILDGEDPKELFQANFGRPTGTYIIRTEWIDPSGPAHDERFGTEREALDAFRQRWLKMPGGEWYLKLLFQPDQKIGQPLLRTKRLIFSSYDRGDDQLKQELRSGADVLQAFRDYEARSRLGSKLHRQAYKKFPNTGEPRPHYRTGEMEPTQAPEDWFRRDEYFRSAWGRRAKHPPDCQCYYCQQQRRPSAREWHRAHEIEEKRYKAKVLRRWRQQRLRARQKGQPEPPQPQEPKYGGTWKNLYFRPWGGGGG